MIHLLLVRFHLDHIAQPLPNLDFLIRMDRKLKVIRCLEYQNDSAAQAEPAHLLGFGKRLAVEDG